MTAEDVFQSLDYVAKLNKPKTVWSMIKSRGKGRPVLDLQKDLLSGPFARLRA